MYGLPNRLSLTDTNIHRAQNEGDFVGRMCRRGVREVEAATFREKMGGRLDHNAHTIQVRDRAKCSENSIHENRSKS